MVFKKGERVLHITDGAEGTVIRCCRRSPQGFEESCEMALVKFDADANATWNCVENLEIVNNTRARH